MGRFFRHEGAVDDPCQPPRRGHPLVSRTPPGSEGRPALLRRRHEGGVPGDADRRSGVPGRSVGRGEKSVGVGVQWGWDGGGGGVRGEEDVG